MKRTPLLSLPLNPTKCVIPAYVTAHKEGATHQISQGRSGGRTADHVVDRENFVASCYRSDHAAQHSGAYHSSLLELCDHASRHYESTSNPLRIFSTHRRYNRKGRLLLTLSYPPARRSQGATDSRSVRVPILARSRSTLPRASSRQTCIQRNDHRAEELATCWRRLLSLRATCTQSQELEGSDT